MPAALSFTRTTLKVLRVLTWAYGGAILALLIVSFVEPEWFFRAIGVKGGPGAISVARGLQIIAALGIATIPLSIAILDRLIAMVDTVRAGDPFLIENARRLKDIAWSVAALEGIHLVIGVVARAAGSRGQPLDINWSFSFTPYLAVLLLFVLANVFEHGARMRADLQGTV